MTRSTNLPIYRSTSLPVYLVYLSPAALRWDERGLITAVVQDAASGQVLMVAWMNAEALELTLATGETHFWSRSRGELWHKGATSGNIQRVDEHLGRLRRRHAADPGGTGRPGVPHRRSELLFRSIGG